MMRSQNSKSPQFPRDVNDSQISETCEVYKSRLLYLRHEAARDGCELNLASESDFIDFTRATSDLHRADLVLVENGNLRLVWRDRDGTQLGLQFLGEDTIQFVIFKQQSGTKQMRRVAGRKSLNEFAYLISTFDLQSLVFK